MEPQFKAEQLSNSVAIKTSAKVRDRPLWAGLGKDPVIRCALLVALVLAVAVFTRSLTTARPEIFDFGHWIFAPLFLSIWALEERLRAATSTRERRFWSYLRTAMALWVLAETLQRVPASWSIQTELSNDFLYLAYFLFFIFAAELRPENPDAPQSPALVRHIDFAAMSLFVCGLLFYLVLIPRFFGLEEVSASFASAYFYIIMDLCIIGRLLYLSLGLETKTWRRTFQLFAVMATIWLAADLLDYLSLFPNLALPLDLPSTVNLLWIASLAPFLLAVRLPGFNSKVRNRPWAMDHFRAESTPNRYWLPLVALAFLLPFLHLLFHTLGLLAPELRGQRDLLILAYLAVLGLFVLVQQGAQERAMLKADRANLAKSQFLADVSHDIRTPMNGILGMAQLLLKGTLPQREREYVEILNTSANGLLQLLDDILDFTKIEAGKLTLETTPFNPRELVDEVLRLLTPRATAPGIGLRFLDTGQLPERLMGDPGRLRQILFNLVGNAIKFTLQGEVIVEARNQSSNPEESRIFFSVRDSGIGIPPEVQARIFTPFAQGGSSISQRFGGTGLGLANCKKLVELMGGTIGLESTPGVGSTFWFEIPLPPADSTPEVKPGDEPTDLKTLRNRRQRFRILVADDEWVNQIIAQRQLEDLGFQVDVVGNGLEVLKALAQQAYDAVLMDCQMPEVDGYEATRQIRRLETTARETKVVAVTASAMEENRKRCLASGMDDFLSKPYREEDLAAVLDRLLDLSIPDRETGAKPLANKHSFATGLDPEAFGRLIELETGSTDPFLAQAVEYFLEQTPPELENMERALAASDIKSLATSAHGLKGSSAALGALRLSQLCGSLSQLVPGDDLSGCSAELQTIAREYGHVELELRNFLEDQEPRKTSSARR